MKLQPYRYEIRQTLLGLIFCDLNKGASIDPFDFKSLARSRKPLAVPVPTDAPVEELILIIDGGFSNSTACLRQDIFPPHASTEIITSFSILTRYTNILKEFENILVIRCF